VNQDVAISVQNVKKTFMINTSGAASLKTALMWWKKRGRRPLHVLRGVSFDVKKGECVAVIGRNGAGKSTLLGLIARIYKPDEGSVTVEGRVAPLLELGAGFHPDLTGAENIIFNAVILGLTRAEAQRRTAQIVEFSELGDQIYMPVRTYSSGMAARLGFSIAVHVDAEILIVDEVLSVGDYAFREKCLKKIKEFRQAGGTILLVSHQRELLGTIVDRCVWIQHGEVHREGLPTEVVAEYYAHSESDLLGAQKEPERKEPPATGTDEPQEGL
jgi:ABC-type polysaccharide/polyol phosphate transport system ATPase subunit